MEAKRNSCSVVEAKIESLSLPREIQEKTYELYLEIQDTKRRKDQRLKYLSFCIHQAYIEMKMMPPDPSKIADMLDISPTVALAAIAKRPPFSPTLVLTSSTISLSDMIRFHAEKTLCLPVDQVTFMVDHFNKLILFDKSLKNDQPKPLIAAFILCYASNNSLKIDIENLAKAFYLESSTIKGRRRKIQDSYLKMLQENLG